MNLQLCILLIMFAKCCFNIFTLTSSNKVCRPPVEVKEKIQTEKKVIQKCNMDAKMIDVLCSEPFQIYHPVYPVFEIFIDWSHRLRLSSRYCCLVANENNLEIVP